jgi:AcrR family transcriptional regulator
MRIREKYASGDNMRRKENIDKKLIESFKELAKRIPIEKITIQEIAEGAGVIRPTFYNHFQDKYQLLEYIFKSEVIMPVKPLIQNDMLDDAVVLIFVRMLEDKEFYGRVYRLQGQNSFESIVKDSLYEILLDFIREYSQDKVSRYKLLSHETLARYYSEFLGFIFIVWIRDGMIVSPQEMRDLFNYIKDHSLYEIIREME